MLTEDKSLLFSSFSKPENVSRNEITEFTVGRETCIITALLGALSMEAKCEFNTFLSLFHFKAMKNFSLTFDSVFLVLQSRSISRKRIRIISLRAPLNVAVFMV
jgi:hypothetical protein